MKITSTYSNTKLKTSKYIILTTLTILLLVLSVSSVMATPSVSSVSIPNVAMKVNDVVTATITVADDSADNQPYILVSGTIGGFTLGGLSRSSSTSYTATFTITNGGTNVAAGANIPVANLILNNTIGESNAAFTGNVDANAADAIDANRPTVVISLNDTSIHRGEKGLVSFTFTEPVFNFDDTDIIINSNFTTLSAVSTTDNITWTTVLTPYDTNEGSQFNNLSIGTSWNDYAGNAPLIGNTSTNYTIDTLEPGITFVNTSKADGTYKAGDVINFTVNFSESVYVTGIPNITLNSGGYAFYSAGNGSIVLTFTYTVASGENSADLGYSSQFSLNTNNGTHSIKDILGNYATNFLPATGTFTGAHAIIIDTASPVLTFVNISSNNVNTTLATNGDTVNLTFTANETIGTPTVTIGGYATTPTNSSLTTWTALRVMNSSDALGKVNFTINFNDTVGNIGTPVTSITGGSNVTFDNLALNISFVYLNEADMFVSGTSPNNIITLRVNAADNGAAGIKYITANFSQVGLGLVNLTDIGGGVFNTSVALNSSIISTHNFDVSYITITDAKDNAGNSFTFTGVNQTQVILYNMTTPPSPSPLTCTQFGPLTTDFSTTTNFAAVNFIINIQANFSCMAQGLIPGLDSNFRDVMILNLTSVNLSTPQQAQKLSLLQSAMSVTLIAPNQFGDARIYINSTAFAELNTTSVIKFFYLPFTRLPAVIADIPSEFSGSSFVSNGYDSGLHTSTVNLTINVTGFSGYNVTDNSTPIIAFINPTQSMNTSTSVQTVNISINGTGTTLSSVLIIDSVGGLIGNLSNCSQISTGSDAYFCAFSYNFTQNTQHTLIVNATDFGGAAGNRASSNITFNVDNVAPTVNITAPVNSGVYNTTVSLNYIRTDSLSGISNCSYRLGNSSGYYSISIASCANVTSMVGVTSGSNNVTVYANDSVGNIGTSSMITFTVDTAAPVTVVSGNTSNVWVATNVTLTFTASDTNGLTVNATYFKVDSGSVTSANSTTISTTGNHTVIFYSIDNVGNREANNTIYVLVDRSGPTTVTTIIPTTNSQAVDLGTAGNYVILAKTGVSTTGTTTVTGNIGVSPAAATFITGFDLIMDASNTFSTSSLVTGNIYAADYTSPTPANMTTAISDMQTAYTNAAGRATPDYTELGTGNIGGMNLTPGLYKWGTGVTIPTDLVLNCSGDANGVFIFQIAQTLSISNGKRVNLTGGCQAQNIFWQVAGQTTLGTTSVFNGNILDMTAIVIQTGATLNGRALAQTAVTLDSNNVTVISATAVAPTFTWKNADFNVTLSATGISSVSYINYTLNGVSGQISGNNGTVLINTSQNNTLVYYAVDSQNNVESPHTIYPLLDTVAPTISIVSPANSTIYNATVALNYVIIDSLSGVSNCWYQLGNSSGYYNISIASCANVTSMVGVTSGLNNVTVYANDSANNLNASSRVNFTVDTTAPVTTVSGNSSLTWTASDVTLNFTSTDAVAGVLTTYSNASGTFVQGNSTTVSTTGNHTIIFYSLDNVGNREANKTVRVLVDKTGPTVGATNPGSNWLTTAFSVVLNATDANIGTVSNVSYSLNGAAYNTTSGSLINVTISGNGNNTLTYYATDSLGNNGSSTTIYALLRLAQAFNTTTVITSNFTQLDFNSSTSGLNATITVPQNASEVTLNFTSLISGITVVISGSINATVNTTDGIIDIKFPNNITINGTGWDGTLTLPKVKEDNSSTPNATTGYNATSLMVVEVGSSIANLTFNKAVRLVLPGMANKLAGYQRGITFTKITNNCTDDTQATNDNLTANTECKYTVGSDLVIWTKHFTSFVAYEESDTTAPGTPTYTLSKTGTVYVGDSLTATCTATDAVDGTVSHTTTLSTSSAGSKTATCTVTDAAGNSKSVSVSYTVTAKSSTTSTSSTSATPVEQSTSQSNVAADTATEMSFSKEGLAVTNVEFTLNEEASNVRIIATSLLGKPSGVGDVTSAKDVYGYIEISHPTIDNSKFKTAKLNFKVEKTWMTSRDAKSEEITLYRYVDNAWTELKTSATTDDSKYYYFSAETPGFSYFAIGVKEAAVVTPVATTTTPPAETPVTTTTPAETPKTTTPAVTETPPNIPTKKSNSKAVWLIIGAAIVALAVGFYFFNRGKKNEPVIISNKSEYKPKTSSTEKQQHHNKHHKEEEIIESDEEK